MPFQQTGMFNSGVKKFAAKGKRAIQSTINRLNRVNEANVEICSKLYESLVNSMVLYAVQVWGVGHLQEIE